MTMLHSGCRIGVHTLRVLLVLLLLLLLLLLGSLPDKVAKLAVIDRHRKCTPYSMQHLFNPTWQTPLKPPIETNYASILVPRHSPILVWESGASPH